MRVQKDWWNLELEGKPDFEMAMQRIYAWYEGEMLDRPPVRFIRRPAASAIIDAHPNRWANLKERWFDAEYQVECFRKSIQGQRFYGETFPIFWPNLGPNVYAAFYGCNLEYGEVTSWIQHPVHEPDDVEKLKFNRNNEYFVQIEKMTKLAIEDCAGKYMVGYTDLHPGMDCVADWRGQEQLCMDFYDHPELVERLVNLAQQNFEEIYNHFDAMLKERYQLSVSWLGIPSFGKMHIPSCDFSALISTPLFKQYCLPILLQEVKIMTHNIFHLDGKGVARHIDLILDVPEINAIQWTHGVGADQPIMQWITFIKKLQRSGKSVVVDLTPEELEEFIDVMEPKGLYLFIASDNEDQDREILKRVTHW
jgi:hypothetical protein